MGAGGLAKELAVLVADINRAAEAPVWNLLGYVDASSARAGEMHGRHPILGDDSYVYEWTRPLDVAVAIGWPEELARAHSALAHAAHVGRPTLVHPSALRDPESVVLGTGCVVCAGAILGADVSIGTGTIVNFQAFCGHDVSIGAHCVLNVGVKVSGGSRVGDRCLVGSGAVILQNIEVGADSIVGAGAVVTRNVPAGVTVAGVPARVLGGVSDTEGRSRE